MSEVIREVHKLDYDLRVAIHIRAHRAGMTLDDYIVYLSEKEAATTPVQPHLFTPNKPK